jgi:hypothetical protein
MDAWMQTTRGASHCTTQPHITPTRSTSFQASEINEKLGDALAAAGDLPAAREALQACLEARMQLFRE